MVDTSDAGEAGPSDGDDMRAWQPPNLDDELANDNIDAEPEGDAESEGGDASPEPSPKLTEDVQASGKHRVKVSGQELDLTLDEVLRLAEKGGGAELRMREANEAMQLVRGFVEQFGDYLDPQTGAFNRVKFAEDEILARIADSNRSPEERERLQLAHELEQLRAERDRYREEHEQQARTQAQAQAEQHFQKSFNEAAKTAGLRVTDAVLARMAYYAHGAVEAGEDPDPTALAQMVREEYLGDFRHHWSQLTPAERIQWMGEDQLKSLRQADLERVKTERRKAPAAVKATNGAGQRRQRNSPTSDEFFANLREQFGRD
jgi:hypothetical protein